MIVVVDEREIVIEGYKSMFNREGFPVAGFSPDQFSQWADCAADEDLESVVACLVGNCGESKPVPNVLQKNGGAALIALVEQQTLSNTLDLFESGFDDVVRKPVHVREILARITAIRKRNLPSIQDEGNERLKIYFDGRDPEVDGEVFPLPRRERRILEYLASVGGRRVSRAQIFNATYGVFDENVEECVVESHISKLRKKLRNALGFDPIDSKRYLGYRLVQEDDDTSVEIRIPDLAGASAGRKLDARLDA